MMMMMMTMTMRMRWRSAVGEVQDEGGGGRGAGGLLLWLATMWRRVELPDGDSEKKDLVDNVDKSSSFLNV
jgi:hypothetical protein